MRGLLPFAFNWKQYLPFGLNGSHPTRHDGEVRDTWRLQDGTAVMLRAARRDDGALIQELVDGLSLQTRYHRFFYPLHELTPDMLDRFTQNDPADAFTLLIVIRQGAREVPIAMAQYVADGYPAHCDFAVVVADDWQRNGLGTRLIQTLVCIARAAGIERIQGDILAENEPMRRLMLKMGFRLTQHEDGAYLRKASKLLDAPQWKCSPLAVQRQHDVRAHAVMSKPV